MMTMGPLLCLQVHLYLMMMLVMLMLMLMTAMMMIMITRECPSCIKVPKGCTHFCTLHMQQGSISRGGPVGTEVPHSSCEIPVVEWPGYSRESLGLLGLRALGVGPNPKTSCALRPISSIDLKPGNLNLETQIRKADPLNLAASNLKLQYLCPVPSPSPTSIKLILPGVFSTAPEP